MMKRALLICLMVAWTSGYQKCIPKINQTLSKFLDKIDLQKSSIDVVRPSGSNAKENLLIEKQFELKGECNGTFSLEVARVVLNKTNPLQASEENCPDTDVEAKYFYELEKKIHSFLEEKCKLSAESYETSNREKLRLQNEIRKLEENIKFLQDNNVDPQAQQTSNEETKKLDATIITCVNDLKLANTSATANKLIFQETAAKLTEYEIMIKKMETTLNMCQEEAINATALLARRPIIYKDDAYSNETIRRLEVEVSLATQNNNEIERDKNNFERDLNKCMNCCTLKRLRCLIGF